MKPYIIWLAVGAIFSLAFRIGVPIKPFDALAVILGIAIVGDGSARTLARRFWSEARPYAKYFLAFLLFTCIAQTISWFRYDLEPWSPQLLAQYARLAFNGYTFFLSAFLLYSSPRLITLASRAIFISPILALPAHWAGWQASYVSGIRLAGLLENPIVFSSWMMVAFLIGIGLYCDAKRPSARIGIAAWLVVIANFILWSASRSAWVALPFGLLALLYVRTREQGDAKDVLHVIGLVVVSFALGQALLVTARVPSSARLPGSPDEVYAIKNFVTKRVVNLITDPTKDESRITIWREALSKNFRSPFGFGMYGNVIPEQFPDAANSYLETLEAGGLGALFAFLLILVSVGRMVKRTIAHSVGERTGVNMAWFAIAVAIVINIFFYNFFFTRNLWFVLGAILGVALHERDRQNNAGDHPPVLSTPIGIGVREPISAQYSSAEKGL